MGCGYFVRLFVSLVRIVFIAAIFNFIHSMNVWNCSQRQLPAHDSTGHCPSIEAPLRLFAFFIRETFQAASSNNVEFSFNM
jgi:hypothetical protein